MTQSATTRSADRPDRARPRGEPTVHTLDDLARLTASQAEALYRRAGMPERMEQLDGDLVGRMLALRGTGGVVLRSLAAFARSGGFPWGGKSFAAKDATSGTGINRVHLGGRHRLFPFRTRFGASVIDGGPAVILDYGDPDNPGFIRAIHDEVREVSPGLYFGPACWKGAGGKTTTILWFGLDTRGVGRVARPS
jgi:hypothetical protein